MNRTTVAAIAAATVAATTFGIAAPATAQIPAGEHRDHAQTTGVTDTHRLPYMYRAGEHYIF